MSPTSRVALRLLTTVLLAGTVANAVALPHRVLDPREAAVEVAEFPAAQVSVATRESVENDENNVFDDVADVLRSHSALQLIKDFFARLFGWDDEDQENDEPVTTTVFVTSTPIELAGSEALVASSAVVSATTPASESTDGLMSILPFGPLTTAINIPLSDPALATGESEPIPSTFAVLLPPFPVNTTGNGPTPTAVLITDEFPAIPPGTGLLNWTALPYPWGPNDSASVINPTLILTNPLRPTELPSTNETFNGTATITANMTSVVVVTATVIALPIGTGDVSVGTGLPTATDAATGLYPNITSNIPTVIIGTGNALQATGLSNANVSEIPLFPNTTFVSPTLILSTGDALQGTGLSNLTAIEAPMFPNNTYIQPTPVLSTGAALQGTGISNVTAAEAPIFANSTYTEPTPFLSTGAAVQGTGISNATVTELPLFSNTTLVIPTLITVTGDSAGILNATIPVTIAPFENTTIPQPTPMLGTGSLSNTNVTVTFTNVPLLSNATLVLSTVLPGTGILTAASGTGAPVSFTETPLSINTTNSAPIAPLGTGTDAPSASATGAVVVVDPIFPNVTTITTTTTIAGTGVSLLSSGTGVVIVPSQAATEIPGLLTLRNICRDPQVRVITVPLLSRFYGPGGYPSLFEFPGCTTANSRQAEQAPGLLNCTALGTEVKRCQSLGRKVLLSVKADGLDATGGNAAFGSPDTPAQPFGPYVIDASSAAGATFANDDDESDGQEKRKRQNGRPSRPRPSRVPGPPSRVPGPPSRVPGPPSRPAVAEIVKSVLAALDLRPSSGPVSSVISSSVISVPVISSIADAASTLPLIAAVSPSSTPLAASPEVSLPVTTQLTPASSIPLIPAFLSEVADLTLVSITSTSSEPVVSPEPTVSSEPTDVPTDLPFEFPNWSELALEPHYFFPTPIFFTDFPTPVLATPEPESLDLGPVIETPEPLSLAPPPVAESNATASSPASGPTDVVLIDPSATSPESSVLLNSTGSEPVTEDDPPLLVFNGTISVAEPTGLVVVDDTLIPLLTETPFTLNVTALTPTTSLMAEAVDSVPTPAPTELVNGTIPVATGSPVPISENSITPSITVPTSGPVATNDFPNLFDDNHPPTALALTLFSLFGEGHTERADLRPLGPDVNSTASPADLKGTDWLVSPSTDINALSRPLGEEVVVDGFDVQIPLQWKGTYQDGQFRAFVAKLRQLNGQAWRENGAVEGGPGDLGADGRSVVYFGWAGELLKREASREGWVEWDGSSS